MAGFINMDETECQVESLETSASQFSKHSEIRETKGSETEKFLKRVSLPPNKINNNKINSNDNNNLEVVEKVIKDLIAKRTFKLQSIISQQEKTIADLKLALTRKHNEEREVSPSSQDQSTETEPLPLFPIKPAPPKEGVPRKNGRHHRRLPTYPFSQDGMPSNNYLQCDVGTQTVKPLKPKKRLLLQISLKPESKERRPSLQDGLPPISV